METTTTAVDTREALLDAAESLFGEHGLQAASLRAITQQAGANLAAVHYHFGSKEGLIRAVFERRMQPMNEKRLAMLAACDLGRPDAVEQVLCAFLEPLLRLARDPAAQSFARLAGRVFSEPTDEVRTIVVEQVSETFERFFAVLRRLLPDLPENTLMWRMHFVAGSMGHTVACGQKLEQLSRGRCRLDNVDEALAHLINFLAAGLRAPAPVSGAASPGSPEGD
jgi:AcrR family transcriptional regulator